MSERQSGNEFCEELSLRCVSTRRRNVYYAASMLLSVPCQEAKAAKPIPSKRRRFWYRCSSL